MVQAGISRDGRGWIDIEVACENQKGLSKIFTWSKRLGIEPPKAKLSAYQRSRNVCGTAGLRNSTFQRMKTTLCRCSTCEEPNKICLAGILPQLTVANGKMKKCNHLLIASEPIGDENIWEEIPDGALLALDRNWQVKMCPKPDPILGYLAS